MINTYAPTGGIEMYMLDLLPQLALRGHQNALIYREQHPRTPATAVPSIYHVPVTADAEQYRKKVTAIIEQERPSVIYMHDVYDPQLMLLASRMAPSVGYVHIFYPVCPGLGKLYKRGDEICTRAYGPGCVPMIYLRQCASARHPRSVYRIMRQTKRYLAAYRALSSVVVGSQYMRDLMIQNGIAPDRIDILPPILDQTTWTHSAPDRENPTILFAGRLEYEKGVPYLLRALREMETPCTLVIAGDGSLRLSYTQLAAELRVAGRVQFARWLSPEALQTAYWRSVATAMPTIMAEPFGKVGVEAMANGRPVVAFDVGGISDWLRDGHNGFLVPPRDVQQLAARLDQLLQNPDLAEKMGQNGRRYVQENYTGDKHLAQLLPILERAAGADG